MGSFHSFDPADQEDTRSGRAGKETAPYPATKGELTALAASLRQEIRILRYSSAVVLLAFVAFLISSC